MLKLLNKLFEAILIWFRLKKSKSDAEKDKYELEMEIAVNNKNVEAVEDYVKTKEKIEEAEVELSKQDNYADSEIKKLESNGSIKVSI